MEYGDREVELGVFCFMVYVRVICLCLYMILRVYLRVKMIVLRRCWECGKVRVFGGVCDNDLDKIN